MKGGNKVTDLNAVVGYEGTADLELGTGNGQPSKRKESLKRESTFTSVLTHGSMGSIPTRVTFEDPAEESLYQQYLRKIRRDVLSKFLMLSMLFDTYGMCMSVVNFDSSKVACLCILAIAFLVNIVIFVLLKKGVFPETFFKYFPYIVWCWLGSQILMEMDLNRDIVSPRASLGFYMLFLYSTYVMLPVQWYSCALLSIFGAILHALMTTLTPTIKGHAAIFPMAQMIGANLFLYVGTCLLGVVGYFAMDRSIRKSFIHTKGSLSIHIEMEDRSNEQERLLNSVLPKHVADEMIKDMGAANNVGQFRKIYMNRHENVSILFADIVGFTALSSTMSGAELVQLLNDLFVTFDQLGHKYHQLRIKILGDCYYCICGCPKPRRDHAVLSIHMGLAMVEAIGHVRKKTNSDVNMRVGIHTGAVLGGVLGQLRWQYDVLGKEVTLANQMESGGIPGRVHISQVTKQYLNGEFELEAGEGEKREEAVRMAGLKTFFVQSVIKQHPLGTLDEGLSLVTEVRRENVPSDVGSQESLDDQRDTTNERLYAALMEREEKTRMMDKLDPFTLSFKDSQIEKYYLDLVPRFSGAAILCLCLALLMIFCAQLTLQQIDKYGILGLTLGLLLLLLMGGIILAGMFRRIYPARVVQMADYIEGPWWLRTFWAALATIIIALSVASSMGCCVYGIDSSQPWNASLSGDTLCAYPPYFTDFGVLIIIGINLMVQFDYLWKSAFSLVITVFYIGVHFLMLDEAFGRYDDLYINPNGSGGFVNSKVMATCTIIAICIAMIYLSRHLDYLSRKLFFYQYEVRELQKQISELKEKNTQLIYNLLPDHVAIEFIGPRKKHNELYSQEHEAVGVMFAACPNFNEFYTEDAVNHNGLECIRLLNEILSDFDDLLHDPRFQSAIVKIKTIGATVMCASGMNVDPSKSASVTDKWRHLCDLLDFGLAMKEALDRINSQSFNNFMLRIGLYQGPILAGVIGSMKPHYDIWGNTVNVASRMESTGLLGKVQVVEETKDILSNFGYQFAQRGLIKVKGKGDLMTYFLK